MNIPRVIRWGFDPRRSKNPGLATPQGRLMYGVIRAGHIVDQHFNRRFQAFADAVVKQMPASGVELADLAREHGLRAIGTDVHKGSADKQWWGELHAALRGELEVREEYPAQTEAQAQAQEAQ